MAVPFDPQLAPLLGADGHLPAVASDRLTPASLRQRFRSPPTWEPEIAVERFLQQGDPLPASVLVPLVMRDAPTVLLTRRMPHLRAHAGQISFPGGRVEAADPDPVHTALREAHEEVGLPGEQVEVIGALPTYTTGTGFVVTPVVGLVEPDLSLRPDPAEVEEIFEVPLSFLMTPAHHQRRGIAVGGRQLEFFAMPWRPGPTVAREYFIWGATAAMLRNLYRFLAA